MLTKIKSFIHKISPTRPDLNILEKTPIQSLEREETINLLTFRHRAFREYKETVRGNSNTSYLEAQKKITRNYLLSYKYPKDPKTPNRELCQYGSLKFLIVDGKVVYLKNRCYPPAGWSLDKKEYRRLSKVFNIKDSHTSEELEEKDAYFKQYSAKKEVIQ